MVTQWVPGLGMREHIERAVIARELADPVAEARDNGFAQSPRGVTACRIEIDVRVPTRDAGHIELDHALPLREDRDVEPCVADDELEVCAILRCRCHGGEGGGFSRPATTQ